MVAPALLSAFEDHSARLRDASRRRRDAVRLKATVLDTEQREEVDADDALGKWGPGDEFQGDVNLRTLRALLAKIDELGFERCAAACAAACAAGPDANAYPSARAGRRTSSSSTAPSSARSRACSTKTTGSSRSRRS